MTNVLEKSALEAVEAAGLAICAEQLNAQIAEIMWKRRKVGIRTEEGRALLAEAHRKVKVLEKANARLNELLGKAQKRVA